MEGDLFGLLPPQEDLLFAQSLAMLSNAWHQVFFPQERCSLAEAQSSRQGGPLCDESASHRSQVRGPWANGPMGRWGWENCIRKTCFSVMINESQSFEHDFAGPLGPQFSPISKIPKCQAPQVTAISGAALAEPWR